MFIDVTRYGGMRILRVAVAAIAYLDACEGGAAVHLIGGETLRVNEDPAKIEQRVDATLSLSVTAAGYVELDRQPTTTDIMERAEVVKKDTSQPLRKGRRA